VSPTGTAAYDGLIPGADLPPLVECAVDLARRLGFTNSCRPEHGRLLRALAAGARPGTRLVSVEIDAERAGLVASLFADLPHLAVLAGDWREIYRTGPFDLLVLDGGAHGKSAGIEQRIPDDPQEWLKPGGTLVIDDLTPASTWPPRFGGQVDQARMYWLAHPALDAAELRLAPDLAALVATRRFPAG
jgi:predicted O-methyltransferase YrrM